MRPVRIMVVDDEAPARARLRDLLATIDGAQLAAEAAGGAEAVSLAAEHAIDLVLLDIRMPGMDGIEVAGHLQRLPAPPAVIFTTAYDAYALQAFDLNAVDYLLKPVRRERLQAAIDKAGRLNAAQWQALAPLRQPRSCFSVTERGKVLLIPLAEVVYLRAELKYITLRTREREYLLEDSLITIEREFGAHFVRLHRNCLVAAASIRGYERRPAAEGESHYVALLDGVPETIAVSRRQQHVLKALAR